MKWLLPLLLLLSGCQNFANRFASVEKICGTGRAPQTHYVELYSSQGERLSRGDVLVSDQNGQDHSELFTEKGCLTVADASAGSTLILRHRLLPEGLPLAVDAVIDGTTFTERSLTSYTYQPPTIHCQDQLMTKEGTFRLFTPPAGLTAPAYRVVESRGPSAAILDIQNWKDGTHHLQGQILEVFSPDQRHYDFSCDLTIDRTPPQFLTVTTLSTSNERIATPGETLSFPVNPRDTNVTLAVCVETPGEECRFQDVTNGQWVAPDSGVYALQVVARDAAGNQSAPLKIAVRIYDKTKIEGIQSELDVLRGLVAEQKGVEARERLKALQLMFASLGTPQEKATVQKALEEVQYAVYLSPDQVKIPKSEGIYVNWIAGTNRLPILVFQAGKELVLRDMQGHEVKRWALSGTAPINADTSVPCVDGRQRELLLKNNGGLFRLTADDFTVAWPSAMEPSNLKAAGDCRYRSWDNGDGTQTLLDLKQAGSTTQIAAQGLWFLQPAQGETFFLLKKGQEYFTRLPGSTEEVAQLDLTGLTVQKVLPGAGIFATDASNQVRILLWQEGLFQFAYNGRLQFNANDARNQSDGGPKTLFRDPTKVGDWYLLDIACPDILPRITLQDALSPERLKMSDTFIVNNKSLVAGLLDLTIYDHQGNPLSLLRLDDVAPVIPFKDVINDRLLIEGQDNSYRLLNPLPHTTLGNTRNSSAVSMQWGGPAARYTRQVLSLDDNALLQEILTVFGRSWKTEKLANINSRNRLLEKPFAVLGDRAVFVSQFNQLVLVQKDGSRQTLSFPGVQNILRVDFSASGDSLLFVGNTGAVFEQSLLDLNAAPIRILDSLWKGCSAVGKRTVDFARATETYVRVLPCKTVSTIDRKGQIQPLDAAADADWITAQTSDDGKNLFLLNAKGAVANGVAIRPTLANGDALNFGRMNSAGTFVVLISAQQHVFIVRLSDRQIWDLALPKGRPLNVDDLSFTDNTFTLLAEEGLIDLPLNPEALPKE